MVSFLLETDGDRIVAAGQVLIAAGAFTACHALLPRPLAFGCETETILLARVSEEDANRLQHAPTVIYLVDDPEIWDTYMTPPIRYPDGHHYIKIGANSIYDDRPDSLEAIGRWFRSGDSDRSKGALVRAVRSLWPGPRLHLFSDGALHPQQNPDRLSDGGSIGGGMVRGCRGQWRLCQERRRARSLGGRPDA